MNIKFIELIRKAHIFSIFHALLILLSSIPFLGASVLSQPSVLTNGRPTLVGLDAGIHLDSPTRKKIDLSGTWTLSFDDETWLEKIVGTKSSREIKVPSSIDYEGRMTFTRSFAIDKNTLNSSVIKFVALGINYECEIFINDVFIGKHTGGYTSFEFEVPDEALQIDKENIIKVIVSNTLSTHNTIPVRKQVWGWKNFGGIVRDIYLLVTPRLWIDRLRVHSKFDVQTLQTTLLLDGVISNRQFAGLNHDSVVARQKQVSYFINAEVYERFTDVLVAQGLSTPLSLEWNKDAKVELVLTAKGAKPWSPENPNLYLLKTSIVEGDGKQKTLVDQYNLNVGFATVQIEGQAFTMNGSKIVLKGVVWHEDSPRYGASLSYEEMEKDIILIKSLGANAVRFAFHPPHPYMLNLCSRYGLIVFEEAPVCNIPEDLLDEEGFQIVAESQLREMIERDNSYPCVVAWGIGDHLDSADKRTVEFIKRMKSVIHSSDDRTVYYGSSMLKNDECASAADFVGITIPPSDLKIFRTHLAEWEKSHPSQLVIILSYGKEVDQRNRNGYSDPLSQESQERYFYQYYAAIKEANIAGSFIDALSDWRGDRPLLNFGFSSYYIHPIGLLSATREKRLAYDVVRALYNDERVSPIPAGNFRAGFPIAQVLTGLFVIIFIGYMYMNHRFSESLKRSLLRSYNFFADLRNLHSVSVMHTLILAIAISLTLAGLLSGILLHYRGEMFADYVLTYFLISDIVKEQIIHAAWHPFAGIVVLTGLFFLCGCFLALLIRVFAFLVRVRVSWFHVYSVSIWAAAPIIFLSPLAMSIFKIIENSSYVLPVVIIVLLFLIWTLMRILKGISVIYEFRTVKTYVGGILLCIILLGGLFFYYDSVYALRSYLKLMTHVSKNFE